MAYTRRRNSELDKHQDEFDPFLCPICSGIFTADRPPTLNMDNCSCSQAGAIVNDPGIFFNHGHSRGLLQYPVSNSEVSDISAKIQEGADRTRDPGNKFLPLGPVVEHRQSDSLGGQLSYNMTRYLAAMSQMERSGHGPIEEGDLMSRSGNLDPAQVEITSKATRGRRTSEDDRASSSCITASGSSGTRSAGMDLTVGIGGWIGDSTDSTFTDCEDLDDII